MILALTEYCVGDTIFVIAHPFEGSQTSSVESRTVPRDLRESVSCLRLR